jgi:hypothetical protein
MHRAFFVVLALLLLPCQAEARHQHRTTIHHAYSQQGYHHAYSHHAYARHSAFRRAYIHGAYGMQNFRQSWAMASPVGRESVVGSRPSGCPSRFCGCEASLYKFGRIIPELNLASNWRRFPRTAPAPGMAAVRSGHVMILQSQVAGNIWNVHDGNSGGHVTREHARSIAGYTIVDPSAAPARYSSASYSRFM